ncbi:sigma-70 family RNA polymerase sigma factor [Paenibacillus xylanexedens]|uniref:DNA-directed RNA polymerase specialized sigma subunit n=1 Tax=Paenibacillus xylanexedens TaxID=528191 RepID=A0ABS4RNF0_PAEXY|nr:sigma-70 family RNA polymerase sigma factor [Paenibacillus xylanexedens]MBP2243809.1 DNA-directed RNA polymerase specialized sigma subunit [Paenibacillus xylanexedens]
MDNNQLTELLKDYRSYKFAVQNLIEVEANRWSSIYDERAYGNLDGWDKSRYSRIVNLIDGAVNEVLSDDQRMVIMRKYLDRNTMDLVEISKAVHIHRTTVGRWHTEAIRRLSVALAPLSYKDREISNIDFMFNQPA